MTGYNPFKIAQRYRQLYQMLQKTCPFQLFAAVMDLMVQQTGFLYNIRKRMRML